VNHPAAHALLFRAWLETRRRFLAGCLLLAAMVACAVLRAPETIRFYTLAHAEDPLSYGEYIWLQLHSGYAQAIWVLCALLLGIGGLRREHAAGTAAFTLALPVRRGSVLASHALVGAAELGALALIPALLLPLLSPLAGLGYPPAQALRFAATTWGGGLVIFGMGLLLAHLLTGELAAASVGEGALSLWFFIAKLPALQPLNVFYLMNGAGYLDGETLFFIRGIPWSRLAISLGGAALLIALAGVRADRADY
jgi:ABC-type transport system involved in multi-copper enzyme maturation permease subunit